MLASKTLYPLESLELAQTVLSKYGSPCFLFDESLLKLRAQQLLQALKQIPAADTKALYACKANTNLYVMRLLRACGIRGIDSVSVEECEMAIRAGYEPADIIYTANNASNQELAWAAAHGIMMNVGELSTLQRVAAAAKQVNQQARVAVRINPDIGSGECSHVITAGRDTKFGIPFQDTAKLHEAIEKSGVKVVGLHQHIGSNIMQQDFDKYTESVRCIFNMAAQFPELEFINIGGGIGIPYRKRDIPLDLNEAYKRVGQLYKEIVQPLPHGSKIAIYVEPGRYLVGESCQLLCKVTAVKESFDTIYIGTDTGFNHLIRPAFYGSYHEIVNLSKESQEQSNTIVATIVGNICESGDVFGKDRDIHKYTDEGDILAIKNAGAYCWSMASTYNCRPRPPEVIYTESAELKLIRRRETLEDILVTQEGL